MPDHVRVGVRILQRALESPLRQLVANAGLEGSVIVDDVRTASANTGYDVAGGALGDMFELGILDPVKVSRAALENAVSVAALMLTTESLVAERKEEKPAGPPGGMPPGMDDMGMGMGGF